MSFRPPALPWTSRLLVRAIDRTAAWSPARAAASAIGLFALILTLDALTAATFSVSFLYFVACAFAVWCLGLRGGMAVTYLGALAITALKHAQLPHLLLHPVSPWVEIWNLVGRMLSFTLFGAVVNGLRAMLALERWRAVHDGLTGTLNKRGFEQEIARIAQRAQPGGSVVLAYMDLDGFKQVNDQHGHSAGDGVLCAFGHAARDAIRPTDLFARIGGDEFAALLILPGGTDGAAVAALLHQRLTAILSKTGFAVTCSMGAVLMPGDAVMLDDRVMEQVDALMYEAKRGGKNALRVARGTAVGQSLRAAFPLPEGDELQPLLDRIASVDSRRPARRRAA